MFLTYPPGFHDAAKSGFAEDVKCYSCSAPLGNTITSLCHGTNLTFPTNEEISSCPHGCFEKHRAGKLESSPLCWGGPLEKCTSVGDALYTCSCGTDLCNKNMNCSWTISRENSSSTRSPPVGSSAPPGVYISFTTTAFLISTTASFYDASCYYYSRFVKDFILLIYLLIFFSLQTNFFPYRAAVVYSLV
ncbi:hypothetical protein Ocin01_17263 [Orchesella cincta]|uniref:Uncharacterized protein n=1 Tax=Orchesella cincta TaxID=48709 RepID=A0A1D2M904_ORCCI|nr:hypothetical protein Ocin01_17263 [Orchesella cincta]